MRRVIFVAALVLSACPEKRVVEPDQQSAVEFLTKEGKLLDTPLARITKSALELELARKRLERAESMRARPLPDKLRDYAIQSMIDRRLLAIEAERLQVQASTTAVAKEMQALREAHAGDRFERVLIDTFQTADELEADIAARLTAALVMKREVDRIVKIEAADVRERFDNLSEEERLRPERIHARQIMVRTEDEATAIHQKLMRKRVKFDEMAKSKSIAPEASRGGDVGWFSKGQMPRVFDEMCFPLQPEEISPVMASDLGYHICQLLEREPARPLSFEEARERLRRELIVEEEREAKAGYLSALRKRVHIKIDEDLVGSIE